MQILLPSSDQRSIREDSLVRPTAIAKHWLSCSGRSYCLKLIELPLPLVGACPQHWGQNRPDIIENHELRLGFWVDTILLHQFRLLRNAVN